MSEDLSAPQTPPAAPRWQPLGALDRRVLGVLAEKAKTTPDAYPMSLNGIATGCNQKSNRDPLMQLEPDDVAEALERLRQMGAVGMVEGYGRVTKYRHYLYDWLGVEKIELSVMTELLLRGADRRGAARPGLTHGPGSGPAGPADAVGGAGGQGVGAFAHAGGARARRQPRLVYAAGVGTSAGAARARAGGGVFAGRRARGTGPGGPAGRCRRSGRHAGPCGRPGRRRGPPPRPGGASGADRAGARRIAGPGSPATADGGRRSAI